MIPIPQNAAGRIGLNVLLFLAGVVALRLGQSVIVPMLIALLLATVLGPASAWLNQVLKIRWSLACITVIFGLVLASVAVTVVFSASVTRLVNQVSDQEKLLQTFNVFRAKLAAKVPDGFELDDELLPKNPTSTDQIGIFKYLTDAAPSVIREIARYTVDWSWQVIVILFITFFVLLEGKMLARRAVAIFGPSEEVQAKAT